MTRDVHRRPVVRLDHESPLVAQVEEQREADEPVPVFERNVRPDAEGIANANGNEEIEAELAVWICVPVIARADARAEACPGGSRRQRRVAAHEKTGALPAAGSISERRPQQEHVL